MGITQKKGGNCKVMDNPLIRCILSLVCREEIMLAKDGEYTIDKTYEADENCQWKIIAPTGFGIIIEVSKENRLLIKFPVHCTIYNIVNKINNK